MERKARSRSIPALLFRLAMLTLCLALPALAAGGEGEAGSPFYNTVWAFLPPVVAIALAIGFVFWQRNRTPDYGEPGETTEQGQETDGEEEGGEGGELSSADTKGRIQILSNVNVRNKPTTEGSEVMMVAKTGDTYEYYELVDGAWYHIKLEDGRDGYVSKKYVEDLK